MIPLPPYAALLDLTIATDAQGAPVLTMPFADTVLGRPGFLHGGAIAGLLEMAAIAALRHALNDDSIKISAITMTVDYRRGGRDRPTQAMGIITRLGTRIANVETAAWQDNRDHPIATARYNFTLVRTGS